MQDDGGKTRTIDLKKIRFDIEDADLLESLKQSGTSERKSYASIVKLYVKMGLTLRRNGYHTLEQLETLLKRVSEPEMQTLKDELKAFIQQTMAQELAPFKKLPRKK